MTATQVFLMFLKKNCILDEYLFFRNIIMNDNGNKYFRKRRLYKNTFVEDYLSRNNRALNNFMTRLFILAPNLKHKLYKNPRFFIIRDTWIKEHGNKPYEYKCVGMYVVYYRRLWNKFLKEYIDDSEKKINSPFKKGECYNFKLKNDTRNQHTQ